MPARATFSNQPQIYEISNKQPSSPPLFFFRPPPRPPTFASAGANRGAIRRRVRCTLFMLIKVEEWAVESAKKAARAWPGGFSFAFVRCRLFCRVSGSSLSSGSSSYAVGSSNYSVSGSLNYSYFSICNYRCCVSVGLFVAVTARCERYCCESNSEEHDLFHCLFLFK